VAAPASDPPRYLDRRWLAEHLAEERRSADLLSEVREARFGAQDGVTSILAVVITVATATNQQLTVLIAGLAAALAEVLSMGAGEYMSSKSQREIFLSQIEKERREVEERPGESEAEVAFMLEREGLPESAAKRVAAELARAPKVLLKTMVEKELGLTVDEGGSPLQGALILAGAFAVAALIPIGPFVGAGLGHATYLVADPDAGVAFLVDPDRHIEPYLAAASRLGVLITDSFETHVHNDYVSGSRALAELRPIAVHAGAAAEIEYPHAGHGDGEVVSVGELAVQCVATPGHTPEHMAYLVADRRRSEEPQYLFSGGALLVGHIARVDLLGPALAERLAHSAYETLRERVLTLADYVAVFPTHGGGSACTAGVAGSRWTTVGFERRHNPIARAA